MMMNYDGWWWWWIMMDDDRQYRLMMVNYDGWWWWIVMDNNGWWWCIMMDNDDEINISFVGALLHLFWVLHIFQMEAIFLSCTYAPVNVTPAADPRNSDGEKFSLSESPHCH